MQSNYLLGREGTLIMKKRWVAFIVSIAVAFTMMPFAALEADAATNYTTKASVEKRIKTVNSEITKIKKTYNTQAQKRNKQKKGAIYLMGRVESEHPFIAYNSDSRYWITNPSKLELSWVYAVGYIKPTGKYKKYNGLTCAVAKAVTVSDAALKTKKKLNNRKAEVKKLKASLKDYPVIEECEDTLIVGGSYDLETSLHNYTDKYNKLIWSSSDSDVCTVKNGKITGIAPGTSTITVKASVSNKTATKVIKVVEPSEVIKLTVESDELKTPNWYPITANLIEKNILGLGNYFASTRFESSNTNIAEVDNDMCGSGVIMTKTPGSVDITCIVNGKYSLKQSFVVTSGKLKDTEKNSGMEENNGHYIDLGRTNIDINSKESVYVPIKIGDEIESLDFAISDEYGAEIYNDDIIAELDGRDGNTINLNIYAYCSAGEYIIKVFERDNPSNYKNIYITVNM